MASVEQPPKKRRLYESQPEPETKPASSPSALRSPSPLTEIGADRRSSETLQSLSEEEILQRRRNREEIRSVYECYKRIRFRLAQKDSALTSDLEQAYHYLISASRGCKSAQRIVADLIPRFSSCCPTALEAASKVVINMHDCSLAVINRGEDDDAVAFQTARSCILGLSDICRNASSEATKSSVIQGICSAVFQNVLTFFTSSFEGKDIFQIFGKDILKMLDSADVFNELKEKILDENMSAPIILFKLRALSLLRIFFRYPKNLLAACFHVLQSTAAEGFHKEGLYFLSQVTRRLDLDMAHSLTKTSPEHELIEVNRRSHEATHQALVSDDKNVVGAPSPVSGSCLLGLVIGKDPSLQSWMLPKYKKLCKASASSALSDIISVMEGIFKSYAEVMVVEDDQVDSDVEGPSTDRSCSHPGFSHHETSTKNSGADSDLKIRNGCHDAFYNISGKHLKSQRPTLPVETNVHPVSGNQDISGSRPMDCSTVDHGDKLHSRTLVPWDVMNQQMLSPVTRTPADIRTNSVSSPAMRSSGGGAINSFASPKHHVAAPCTSTTTQNVWYSDGDPATMDIISASKQLWVGLLGSDASEAHFSFQIERFGPVEQYFFFPVKGFAVVEYRSILDAIRAREYLRRHFHWCIKFMDIGLGTRGAMNGVAVGCNCHIYVGNISCHWAKEEILHESRKVVYRGPYMVTDLSNEGALLMEFETPEEAAAVMNHLRQHRRERNSNQQPFNVGPVNHPMSHMDGGRSVPTPARVDFRNGHPGNTPNSNMRSPQIEFSQPLMHPAGSFMIRPDSCNMELVSPRTNFDNHGTTVQGGHPFHSSRGTFGPTEMHEAGAWKNDGCTNNVVVDPLQAGTNVSIAMEQNWSYTKSDVAPESAPSSIPCFHSSMQGPPAPPPPQVHPPPFIRPTYVPPNSAWDVRAIHHNFPLNSIPPGAVPNNFHGNAVAAPPFAPASVTPVMQVQGTPIQHYDQVFSSPVAPPLSSLPPPLPEVPPPLPPSPPPLPQSQPPFVPPPPSSPPPPLPTGESSEGEITGHCLQFRWKGALCKSGVHYCTIYAHRVDSDACKYINAVSEPTEWPAKLDMIKRTDIGHVKSTFTNTPPHKREVCRLTPSTAEDHKGFQDFISYLKQRGCAGVIKIPAVKSIWARLIFIIPNSPDTCSMLSITPSSSDCLIALVLPKETNFEWV